jgi:hypothetical protein
MDSGVCMLSYNHAVVAFPAWGQLDAALQNIWRSCRINAKTHKCRCGRRNLHVVDAFLEFAMCISSWLILGPFYIVLWRLFKHRCARERRAGTSVISQGTPIQSIVRLHKEFLQKRLRQKTSVRPL